MSDRVAIPRPIMAAGELTASVSGPSVDYARRFSLTVAEEALQRIGPEVIPYVVERLAGQIAHEQRGTVEDTVHRFLRDRAWAEPIIRQAIKDVVREYVIDMLTTSIYPAGKAK